MKLMYFDNFKLGVVKDDRVVDVSKVVADIPHTGPHDLINGLIERFAKYRSKLEKAAATGKGVPLSKVRIRPPLPRRPLILPAGRRRQVPERRRPAAPPERAEGFAPRSPSADTARSTCRRP